ncbi:MAG TPA: hypothetical protein VD838_05930 [Anaeromyxobacteraceae bacterium]|nr:hypothetical protein [Anaeromyxobacteraceae bacterium]
MSNPRARLIELYTRLDELTAQEDAIYDEATQLILDADPENLPSDPADREQSVRDHLLDYVRVSDRDGSPAERVDVLLERVGV